MNINQHNRFQKVFSDTMYLLKIVNNKYDFVFNIAGSTHNVYSVKIINNQENNHIFCDCPDMKKWGPLHNVFCKHILFIIFKVVKLFKYRNSLSSITLDEDGEQFLSRKTLSKEHIEVMSVFIDLFNFDTDADFVNTHYIKKFNELKPKKKEPRQVTHVTNCVICFDDFTSEWVKTHEDNISKCLVCVGIFHKECLNKWLEHNNTCPYCRCIMKTDSNSEYANLLDN
jgi:hypothetical protein